MKVELPNGYNANGTNKKTFIVPFVRFVGKRYIEVIPCVDMKLSVITQKAVLRWLPDKRY